MYNVQNNVEKLISMKNRKTPYNWYSCNICSYLMLTNVELTFRYFEGNEAPVPMNTTSKSRSEQLSSR